MNRAFSLVELSIVLVILGLLTGGILAGQSLIRAAELRAVVSEYQRYMAATQTFRDKYFAVPGDFSKATQFWGRTASTADCVSTSGIASTTSPGTCDGDGGGTLFYTSAAASKSGEIFQFWNQLALAGMIEGSYSGYAGSAGSVASTLGTNVPASKLGNAGWGVSYCSNCAGDTAAYALDYGNNFNFGGNVAAFTATGAILKPEEAWNIDTKLDDGKPGYGKIIARYWNNACATGGATNADLANSVYNLSNSTAQCAIHFVRAF